MFVFLQPSDKFDDCEDDWESSMAEMEEQRIKELTNEIVGEGNVVLNRFRKDQRVRRQIEKRERRFLLKLSDIGGRIGRTFKIKGLRDNSEIARV